MAKADDDDIEFLKMYVLDRLQKELQDRKYEATYVCRITGLSAAIVSQYKGGTKRPKYENAVALLEVFGMTLDEGMEAARKFARTLPKLDLGRLSDAIVYFEQIGVIVPQRIRDIAVDRLERRGDVPVKTWIAELSVLMEYETKGVRRTVDGAEAIHRLSQRKRRKGREDGGTSWRNTK